MLSWTGDAFHDTVVVVKTCCQRDKFPTLALALPERIERKRRKRIQIPVESVLGVEV